MHYTSVVNSLSHWKGERRSVGALSVDLVNVVATSPLTPARSLRKREHRIPRRDESKCSGLANARRAILPLPKGEGRGEGEAPLETAMRLRPRALPPSRGSALDEIANLDSASRSS